MTHSISGQQQTFRPFFDTRFTSGLLDFRRKPDPFSNMSNDGGVGGAGYDWSDEKIKFKLGTNIFYIYLCNIL